MPGTKRGGAKTAETLVRLYGDNYYTVIGRKGGLKRSPRKKRTHCMRGHEFTPENEHWISETSRTCKTCFEIYQKDYREAMRRKV